MLSGPYATWVLGALGAEVIKVERPGSGDFTRGVAPFLGEDSVYFLSVNRNKKSITINLKDPGGKALFLQLATKADIVVENNRGGVMDRLGLGYRDISAINPRIVYASISGFGQDGPYRNRPSFDVIAQALSGMMSITGEPDGGPARVGASIGDIGASLFAVIGILSHLQSCAATGRGGYIDVSMLEFQISIMENAFARFLNLGETPRRLGSRHPLIAPFQAFPTSDYPIAVCVDTDAQWKRLCGVLSLEHLVGQPEFLTGSIRNANHSALEPILMEEFRKRDRAEWLKLLEEADVPASAINSMADAVEDPQVRHRGILHEVPAGSNRRFVGLPFQTEQLSGCNERPAPKLGEHTDEILISLGHSIEDIETLRRRGAI